MSAIGCCGVNTHAAGHNSLLGGRDTNARHASAEHQRGRVRTPQAIFSNNAQLKGVSVQTKDINTKLRDGTELNEQASVNNAERE